MSFLVEVWGPYACFTRPEMKTERVSYDVMTPSAARGIMESIYWHPGMVWVIDKIYVRAPIKFMSICTNGVNSVMNSSVLKSAVLNHNELPCILTFKNRIQRSALILKDVDYFIECHFEIFDSVLDPMKVAGIVGDRLSRGRCQQRPYFGCREYPVYFEQRQAVPKCPSELKGVRDLGWMLGDMDYGKKSDEVEAQFFRAEMKNGCISVPREVLPVW